MDRWIIGWDRIGYERIGWIRLDEMRLYRFRYPLTRVISWGCKPPPPLPPPPELYLRPY